MSTFGRVFQVHTFVGIGIISGCPPGMQLTEADIQPQLTRRRPGQSRLTTPRSEEDKVVIQSGTERGMTLGTPISLFVPNLNVKPGDYKEMSNIGRPGHADVTYQYKYGLRASSGGGRASARETIGRVAAGAVAEKFLLETYGTKIVSFVASVGHVQVPQDVMTKQWSREEVEAIGTLRVIRGTVPKSGWRKSAYTKENAAKMDNEDEAVFLSLPSTDKSPCYLDCENNVYTREGALLKDVTVESLKEHITEELLPLRCPHPPSACAIATLIRIVKNEQDSIGGTVCCAAYNVPIGLGEPCFDKLEAMLAHAMMSLPATKGFEMGLGFSSTKLRGSQHNDPFEPSASLSGVIVPKTNNAGGTLGGISSGAPILMRVAVKPVSTIGLAQHTVDYDGNEAVLEAKGRHDPCVLPRCPPLLEAMTALVLIDAALIQRSRLGGSSTMPPVKSLIADPAQSEEAVNKRMKL